MEKVAAYEDAIWDDILEKEALTLDEYNKMTDKQKASALKLSAKRHDALYNKKLLEASKTPTTLDAVKEYGDLQINENLMHIKNLKSNIKKWEPVVKQEYDKYNRSKIKFLLVHPDKRFPSAALDVMKNQLKKEQAALCRNTLVSGNPFVLEHIRQNANRRMLGEQLLLSNEIE